MKKDLLPSHTSFYFYLIPKKRILCFTLIRNTSIGLWTKHSWLLELSSISAFWLLTLWQATFVVYIWSSLTFSRTSVGFFTVAMIASSKHTGFETLNEHSLAFPETAHVTSRYYGSDTNLMGFLTYRFTELQRFWLHPSYNEPTMAI